MSPSPYGLGESLKDKFTFFTLNLTNNCVILNPHEALGLTFLDLALRLELGGFFTW